MTLPACGTYSRDSLSTLQKDDTRNRARARIPERQTGAPFGVLAVGPPLDSIGGMSSVLRQTLSLGYANRYAVEHLPTCHAPTDREPLVAKVRRHARQVELLRQAISHADASIVHLHTCSGFSFYRSIVDMGVARHAGCQTILHIHGGAFAEFFANSGRIGKTIIARSLGRADVVLALSDTWCNTLRRIAPNACVTVIENAVAIGNSAPKNSARADRRCHFVVMGQMDEAKGIGDALAAARILKAHACAFRITLVGPSGTAGDAQTLPVRISAMGLSDCVTYAGPIVGDAKAALLAGCDVFLLPSHSEGMPIAMLEAMAHALPIVATTVGSIPEVVEHGTHGLLVPPSAPHALADAMVRMVTGDDLRTAMGTAARQVVTNRFSLDRLDHDLTRLYDALLCVHASAPSQRTPMAYVE